MYGRHCNFSLSAHIIIGSNWLCMSVTWQWEPSLPLLARYLIGKAGSELRHIQNNYKAETFEIQIISHHFRLSRHGIRFFFCHGQPRELLPDSNRSRWTSHVSIPFAKMLWWLAESVMSLAGSLAGLLFAWGQRNLCKMGSPRLVEAECQLWRDWDMLRHVDAC